MSAPLMAISLMPIMIFIGSFIAVSLCWNATALGNRFRMMDIPDERKKHRHETPLMGGIVLLLAFIPAGMIWVLLDASARWLPTLAIWLASVAAVAAVGIADDRHSLSPRLRLIVTFAVFGIAAAIDPTFNVRLLDFLHFGLSIGLGTWWLAIIFTMVCLVGLLNAVNMADGKNGLVLGLCLGWLLLLTLRAPAVLMPLFALLIAVCGVLFLFNLQGKLFLGDGGAYGLASAVGMLAIITYNTPGTNSIRAISADELVLLFSVPVFDSFRLTYLRMKKGLSPMSPDRNHLHHILQDRFGWPQGLIIYFMVALLPSFAVFMLSNNG